MKKYIIVLSISILFLTHCSKDISITKFKDDYKDYKSEKRIEAILNTTDITKSIVRIDNTILVTDTKYFDGVDNDGDWQSFDDLNSNGKWDKNEPLNDDIGSGQDEKGKGNGIPDVGEPHVDEIDEIIYQLHDSTYVVKLFNKTDNQLIADFKWVKNADEFEFIANTENDEIERISYGAYVPDHIYTEEISMEVEYEYIISNQNEQYKGAFEPVQPARFLLESHENNNDTLMIKRKSDHHIFWETCREGSVFWVLVERMYSDGEKETIESNASGAIDKSQNGGWLGVELSSEHAPGLYKLTVYVPSYNYGHYFYSSLPIRDERVNNLRNQNNEVVLGVAASLGTTEIYFRVYE